MKARSQIIVAAITLAILSPVSHGKEPTYFDPKSPGQSKSTHEELKTANLILAKEFCVALRREDDAAMRRMIDPEYLKRLELGEQDKLPIQIAPVSGIHNIIVAEDGNTLLCLYRTEDGTREAMLLRTTRKEARTFVLPPTPVDPATGLFTPWSLRADLSDFVSAAKSR